MRRSIMRAVIVMTMVGLLQWFDADMRAQNWDCQPTGEITDCRGLFCLGFESWDGYEYEWMRCEDDDGNIRYTKRFHACCEY